MQFFDVVLYTIDQEITHKFPIHKVILYARWPWFSRYVKDILKEEDIRDESGIQMVNMKGIDHQLLQAVLTYLYTDQIDIPRNKIESLSSFGRNYGLVR